MSFLFYLLLLSTKRDFFIYYLAIHKGPSKNLSS